MTIDEILERTIEYLETGDEQIIAPIPKSENPHGKLVEYRFEAFHDVKVYEDGYEEWFPIGD